MTSGKPH
ncbi:hypothetical protein E2C01_095692 [Portunus trituberculatus]|nr:hypothetical protein [Portunus trituberculatus]